MVSYCYEKNDLRLSATTDSQIDHEEIEQRLHFPTENKIYDLQTVLFSEELSKIASESFTQLFSCIGCMVNPSNASFDPKLSSVP